MMTEHGVRADDYLAYVHKIDHSPLEPNPAMGEAIAKLDGRKPDPDQRLDPIMSTRCWRGWLEFTFRRGVRHHRSRARAEAGATDLPEILGAARRRSDAVGDVRGLARNLVCRMSLA